MDSSTKVIPYDELYHLKLVARLSSGTTLKIEKGTYPIIAVNDTDGVVVEVPMHSTFTLKDMIEKTQQLMGKNFWVYTGFEFNCQNFVMNLLKSEGLLTPELTSFVMQNEFDKDAIKKENPLMYHTTNFVTDLNNIINGRLMGGRFRRK